MSLLKWEKERKKEGAKNKGKRRNETEVRDWGTVETWEWGGRKRQGEIMVFWPDFESKNSSQVCLMSSCCQMSLSTQAILQTTADIRRNTYTQTGKAEWARQHSRLHRLTHTRLNPPCWYTPSAFPTVKLSHCSVDFHYECLTLMPYGSETQCVYQQLLSLLSLAWGLVSILQHAVLSLWIKAVVLIILQHSRTWRFIGGIINMPVLLHCNFRPPLRYGQLFQINSRTEIGSGLQNQISGAADVQHTFRICKMSLDMRHFFSR